MKKSTFISLIALGTAVVGVLIALAAYFNKKRTALYEEMDDDFDFDDPDDIEYYSTNVDEDSDCECDYNSDEPCDCGCYDDSVHCDDPVPCDDPVSCNEEGDDENPNI